MGSSLSSESNDRASAAVGPTQIGDASLPTIPTRVASLVRLKGIDSRRHRIASVSMVRWKIWLGAVGCIGLVPIVTSLAACGGMQPAGTGSPLPFTPTSADSYAGRVLADAVIPPGARATTTVNSDFLKQPFQTVGTEGLVDIHGFYVIDELPDAVQTYITTHLPQGASLAGTGVLGGPNGVAHGIEVSLPTSGANENYAELVYEIVSDGTGSSEFRVDAQVIWVANRSADELAPAGAAVDVTGFSQTSLASASSGPVTIKLTSAEADRLRTVANSLPIAPPPSCMEDALLYKVDFQISTSQSLEFDGYECESTVLVSNNHIALSPLNDAGCHLLAAVVSVLPNGQGDATRSALANLCH
jgi:hypothetical protein